MCPSGGPALPGLPSSTVMRGGAGGLIPSPPAPDEPTCPTVLPDPPQPATRRHPKNKATTNAARGRPESHRNLPADRARARALHMLFDIPPSSPWRPGGANNLGQTIRTSGIGTRPPRVSPWRAGSDYLGFGGGPLPCPGPGQRLTGRARTIWRIQGALKRTSGEDPPLTRGERWAAPLKRPERAGEPIWGDTAGTATNSWRTPSLPPPTPNPNRGRSPSVIGLRQRYQLAHKIYSSQAWSAIPAYRDLATASGARVAQVARL